MIYHFSSAGIADVCILPCRTFPVYFLEAGLHSVAQAGLEHLIMLLPSACPVGRSQS